MKKLLISSVVCVFSLVAAAAQCEGLTQKGERCKREAAEGSKYCIGHADQAKAAKPAAAKEAPAPNKAKPAAKKNAADADKTVEKDDGTCWALTEAGKRCTRKKDGEKDYCKQHAADLPPSKPVTQCRAVTYTGEQCEILAERDGWTQVRTARGTFWTETQSVREVAQAEE